MSKIAIEIDTKQIEYAIHKMDKREKWKIAREIIAEQFTDTVKNFRQTIKRKDLTFKQINDIVEKAREKFHAQSNCRQS